MVINLSRRGEMILIANYLMMRSDCFPNHCSWMEVVMNDFWKVYHSLMVDYNSDDRCFSKVYHSVKEVNNLAGHHCFPG
jgi:hypothetical protein